VTGDRRPSLVEGSSSGRTSFRADSEELSPGIGVGLGLVGGLESSA